MTRRDSDTRQTGVFVPSEEAPIYLYGGWRLAHDQDGPIYSPAWALLVPPALESKGERAE